MIINKTEENGIITFVLDGKLDTHTAPSLQDVLVPSFDEAKQVELDFTKVSYVSSSGLRVLLVGKKAAQSKQASMTLRCVSEEIRQIFEMTGFDNILTIV